MRRFLFAFGLMAALAAPAAAQPLQPAGPAPRSVANWVKIETAQDGSVFWLDTSTINAEGYTRSAEFRIDRPDGEKIIHFAEFDCDGGRFRFQALRTINGYPTRVPDGDWMLFDESRAGGRVQMASAARERICTWPR